MKRLIEMAMKALQDNPGMNEVRLDDGKNKVVVLRYSPGGINWATNWPTQYTYDPNYQYHP